MAGETDGRDNEVGSATQEPAGQVVDLPRDWFGPRSELGSIGAVAPTDAAEAAEAAAVESGAASESSEHPRGGDPELARAPGGATEQARAPDALDFWGVWPRLRTSSPSPDRGLLRPQRDMSHSTRVRRMAPDGSGGGGRHRSSQLGARACVSSRPAGCRAGGGGIALRGHRRSGAGPATLRAVHGHEGAEARPHPEFDPRDRRTPRTRRAANPRCASPGQAPDKALRGGTPSRPLWRPLPCLIGRPGVIGPPRHVLDTSWG